MKSTLSTVFLTVREAAIKISDTSLSCRERTDASQLAKAISTKNTVVDWKTIEVLSGATKSKTIRELTRDALEALELIAKLGMEPIGEYTLDDLRRLAADIDDEESDQGYDESTNPSNGWRDPVTGDLIENKIAPEDLANLRRQTQGANYREDPNPENWSETMQQDPKTDFDAPLLKAARLMYRALSHIERLAYEGSISSKKLRVLLPLIKESMSEFEAIEEVKS